MESVKCSSTYVTEQEMCPGIDLSAEREEGVLEAATKDGPLPAE